MRAVDSGQLAALLAPDRIEDVRVWIADAEAQLVDRTAQLLDVEWGEDLDQRAVTARIVLQSTTLAPGLGDAVAEGRAVVIEVVVLEAGDTVTSGDWVEVFRGVIDEWSDGGPSGELELTCLDGWFLLQTTYIEEADLYGSEEGEPIEDVMQALLDDTLGEAAPTLGVAGTPTTVTFEFEQQRMVLADALRALTDTNGWDLRYRWDDAGEGWEYRFFEPPRTNTTPVASFTASQYRAIEEHRSSLTDVRTVCIIDWADDEDLVVAEDSSAIAALQALGYGTGRLVLEIDATQDRQINSQAIASAWAQSIVADLSQPPVTASVDLGRVWWPVEVGDLIEFGANDVHLGSSRAMAVTRWSTRFQRMDGGEFRRGTVLGLRGRPSGGTTRWFRLAKRTHDAHQITPFIPPTPSPQLTVAASFDSEGNLSAVLDGSEFAVRSWRVLGVIDDEHPTQEDVEGATPIDGTALTEVDVGVLAAGAEGGSIGQVAAIGYPGLGGNGPPTTVHRDVAVFGTSTDGIPDGGIGPSKLADGAVTASKMIQQAQQFASTITFSPFDSNSMSWSAGTVTMAGGLSVEVSGGSTNLAAGTPSGGPRWIYFDGSSTLKVATTMADIIADPDRIIMAVGRMATGGAGEAMVVPTFGSLFVNGNNLTGDSIQSAHIQALAIQAGHIQANAVTAAKIDVVSLSAISADVGTLTAGLLQNASGTTFMDLDASGSQPFIQCGTDLVMRANGTAEFGGTVTASNFTASVNTFTGRVACSIFSAPDASNGWLDFGGSANPKLMISTTVVLSATTSAVEIPVNLEVGGQITGNVAFASGGSARFHGPIGFYGASAIAQPTVTGDTEGNEALQNLCARLANLGLIIDDTDIE